MYPNNDPPILIPMKTPCFLCTFLLVCLIHLNTYGQSLNISIKGKENNFDFNQLPPIPKDCPNEPACTTVLQQYLQSLYQKGYWAASFDSVYQDSTGVYALLYLGEIYELKALNVDQIDPKALKKAAYKPSFFEGRSFQMPSLIALQNALLRYYENQAYPFAEVGLTNIQFQADGVHADLQVNKHQRITIDSLLLEGDANISKRFLHRYLNIPIGQGYNEATMQQMESRLRELPYLRLVRTPRVIFIGDDAQVNLALKKKKASKFNLLIGIIPGTTSVTSTGRSRNYTITGDGDLALQNALGAGESLELSFKRYPGNVMELETQIWYPYLPLLPFGGDFRFDLYIKDPEFREITTFAGLQYLLKGNDYFKVFWDRRATDLLQVDTVAIINNQQLPSTLDSRRTFYGLAYHLEQLDYRFNPRKGFSSHVEASIGSRKILPNNGILALDETIYENIDSSGTQIKFNYHLEKYWPLGRASTLKTAIDGAYITNQSVLKNELYRIGGNRKLRGFDEESILTSFYNLLTIEYRLLWGANSYFAAFTDINWLPNGRFTAEEAYLQTGFGVGLSFETKAGMFALSYALGRDWALQDRFQLRNGKVHLGYVSVF